MYDIAAIPVPRPPRRRTRRHPCHYLYCRKVGGRKYQARVWLGRDRGGSLNLGLYDSEWECWRVVKAWLKDGRLPEGVLPKYAFRRPDGGFGARVRVARRRLELGPYDDAAEASSAMALVVSRLEARRLPPLPVPSATATATAVRREAGHGR